MARTGSGSASERAGDCTAATGPRRVRSAERVAAVLELLRDSPRALRHADVAKALALPKSSASNLLDTLTDCGLISREGDAYTLGVKLIELGQAAAERLDVRSVARPVMAEVCARATGTCNLAVLRDHRVLYIEKVSDPAHLIQLVTRVGGMLPAHATALGKVLVGCLSPEDRERWVREHDFAALTERTVTSAQAFRQEMERFAGQGYAVDDEESHPHVMCLAAPLYDHTGQVTAALSLTSLKSDVLRAGVDETARHLRAAADRISHLLGARATPSAGTST
jgi:IclR family transcriptional regulator, KDG regulon repressor